MRSWPLAPLLAVFGGVLAAAAAVGIFYGSTPIPPGVIWQALVQPGHGVETLIVWDLRLPRITAAALAGGALAAAGTLLQAILQNPLADPYIIGASSGAGLGAVVGRELGRGTGAMAPGALTGSLAAFFLVWSFARMRGGVQTLTLILAGYALSVMLAAVTTFLMLLNQTDLTAIFAWEIGGISALSWNRVALAGILIAAGLLLALPFAPELNAFLLGEEQARHVGVAVEKMEFVLLFAAALMTAAAVYLGGLIGFVGLIVPHGVRRLVGPEHRRLLPLSILTGAAFLVLADTVAERVPGVGTLPVGLITAFLGGPYFLYLLARYQRAGPL